jgi:tetratricopeptide (TPR) repeat protein
MTVEQLQDQLQDYLANTMSVTEQTDFERQIKDSAPLSTELLRFRQLRVLLRHQPLLQARATLQTVMAEVPVEPDYGPYAAYFRPSPRRFFPRWRWLMLALAPLLLIGGLLIYRDMAHRQALANIAAAQLQPMVNVIGFAADDPTNAAQAMRAYDRANYTEAVERLLIEVAGNPDDSSLRLYLAVSYLLRQQPAEAEPLLRGIIRTDDLTTVPAKWYLALCLLQRGQKAEAVTLLQSLTADTVFGERAGRTLDELDGQ